MCSLERFDIDLKGLTESETALAFDLDDQFFAALDVSDVQGGALHVSGSIRKAVGFYKLHLSINGTVVIPCDRCLEPMEQPIGTHLDRVVKLGDEYSEEDEVTTIDENEGILPLAWPIYEAIALDIPIQHVHAPGKCNPAMTQALEELSAARSSDAESDQPVDPRWSELLKLKNGPAT